MQKSHVIGMSTKIIFRLFPIINLEHRHETWQIPKPTTNGTAKDSTRGREQREVIVVVKA
jgi:hypothetical protein